MICEIMNLEELDRKMKESYLDQLQIEQIGRTILLENKNQQADIARIFEYCLAPSSECISFKLKILEIMSVILIHPSGRSFIKHFSVRVRSFFAKYSYEVINESQQTIKRVIIMLQTWEKAEIFSDSFMKSIKKSASCFIDKYSQNIQIPMFSKYTKTFLMAYKDVSRITATQQLYKAYCKNLNLQKSISDFLIQIQELSGNKRGVQQSLIKCERHISLLLENINMYKVGTQQLMNMAERIRPFEDDNQN